MPGGRVEAYEAQPQHHDTRGIGVQRLASQSSKLVVRVRFPYAAPYSLYQGIMLIGYAIQGYVNQPVVIDI